jgi:hypothetical protein
MRSRLFAGLGPAVIALALLFGPEVGLADVYPVQPLPPVTSRDPRFGIVQAIHAPELAVEAGATWERIIFPWADMEPQPDRWEPGYFTDRQIRDQVARGFTEVGVVIYTPVWAAPDPRRAPRNVVPRNLYYEWNDPENYWGRFTGKLAARYKGIVDHWIIWNEPDLYDYGSRWFFDGDFGDYYQLLKVAYQSIKANNPRATVILAGMAYWYDKWFGRPPYLGSLLEVAARDPSARRNNWYFDVVAVHTYGNPLNSYTKPMLMKNILDERDIDKPIWILENNAVPGDDPKAPTAPGAYRASQDEQASYIIQSYALGIAAGVERQSIYKMMDEKPEDGQLFGLVRNDRTIRPAYVAYQTAATYLSDARWASYTWNGSSIPPSDEEIDALLTSGDNRPQWIWPGDVNRVVVERGDLRTTVVWNASPRRVRAQVQAASYAALAVTQYGETGQVVAENGVYTLDLAPTVHNTDPIDPTIYLIGGRPWILEEVVAPLPERVLGRVEMLWPHNWAPIEEADLANVTVQLLTPDGSAPVPCRWEPRVLLWASLNGRPSQIVGTGHKEMVRGQTANYPVWRFYNVQIGPARFNDSSMTFYVTVDGMRVNPEYWVYGGENATPLEPKDPPPVSCR